MVAKKYYAVKVGKTPGIYDNWPACKECVDGFPKAEYKGFATIAEARAYLGIASEKESTVLPEYDTVPGRLLTYVDGSYHDGLQKYAFGCVFLLPGHEIRVAYGNGNNPQSLQHRNVTGEMLGAMYAVKTAMKNGYKEIELCYDYEGIEKWVTGAWRSKTELTQKYAQSMREWGESIRICFTKVEAHSKVAYNELADQTAKRGLTEGDGIPRICNIKELELYECDAVE